MIRYVLLLLLSSSAIASEDVTVTEFSSEEQRELYCLAGHKLALAYEECLRKKICVDDETSHTFIELLEDMENAQCGDSISEDLEID